MVNIEYLFNKRMVYGEFVDKNSDRFFRFFVWKFRNFKIVVFLFYSVDYSI